MKNGVRLSEKHGVNPSMIVCAYCGEDTAIALVGKLPGDAEAPRRMIAGLEPCEKCKEKLSKEGYVGITAWEDDGRGAYMGGCLLREEVFKQMFTIPVPELRCCRVGPEIWRGLIEMGKRSEEARDAAEKEG